MNSLVFCYNLQMQDKSKWEFYTDSKQAWDAMLEVISSATLSIDLEQYIFSNDSVGIKFLDALKERANASVRVRIFCDEVGSFALSRSDVVSSLSQANIKIKFFNSVVPWSPNRESLYYFRDHKKLLVIDNKIGFTGGVCLGEEMRNWRESSVRIEGPVVAQMSEAFDVMWNKKYHEFKFYFKKKNRDLTQNYNFNYITNAPLPGKRYMYRELIRAIKNAKHYIYLTTPYFLPDSRLLRNIKKASLRGVAVKILIPMNTNSRLVNIGSGTFFEDMMDSGIHIFRYNGSMIHSKTGVIDGIWSTIGSLNLDNLSLRYNFEGNIVSTDKNFAFGLERQFLDDLKISTKLTKEEWKRRGLIRRILEIMIWPFRKLL
jgi:cardiolipin synthase A/B